MSHQNDFESGGIWRTCNKIRAAIIRLGLNLFEYFQPLDPQRKCLISESQFISVIDKQLRKITGLSEQEIKELADYCRVPDGRIYYTQLCEVIHDNVPDFDNKVHMVTSSRRDPLHSNRLSVSDERRFSVLLTKIASLVNMRRLILRPYFQDFQLVSKKSGNVTLSHFARILAHLNIPLSAEDFSLLVKKYVNDSYTLNYMAFIAEIDQVVNYLDRNGILDLSGDIMILFPGRVPYAELPKLPRPEIGNKMAGQLFGKESTFNPALIDPKKIEHILTTVSMIRDHVQRNRLEICRFFEDFDPFNCGKITVSQFHRGLDALVLSGKQRFFLSLPDVEAVINQYRDPCDPSRVCWRTFEDDMDQEFIRKELGKNPSLKENRHPVEVSGLLSPGADNWQAFNTASRDLCEEAVMKVKQKILHRRILLKPIFRDSDKFNNGHVSSHQMKQVLHSNGILLSDEELLALEERFNDDVGFNYFWFLQDVDSSCSKPFRSQYVTDMNADKPMEKSSRQEQDIVQITAKIRVKVMREKIGVMDLLRDFDRCNEQVISRDDFKRGLSVCNFDLTDKEMKTLMDVFASPLREECVDYRRFSEVVEETSSQQCLERTPLIVSFQHVPTRDCEKNFLNFDERIIVSVALQKLAKKPDMHMNLFSVLQDSDAKKCGTVSRTLFLNELTLRGMTNLISKNEFDVICKCFSFERGTGDEVDYSAFKKALDIIYLTEKYNPF
ncbi:unnamed protein product [Phaedon cochleariae]|uniref:Uncharacterized protein n=1 Tax=Phaedon cochleariae TaxID=80249 RepID=A0A9N9X1H4_PHACE|nr:unnamed protein product [Phaedon cochleariae]